MMVCTTNAIYSKASEFVEGKISFRQFEDWFVPATWNIDQENKAVEGFVDEIESRSTLMDC